MKYAISGGRVRMDKESNVIDFDPRRRKASIPKKRPWAPDATVTDIEDFRFKRFQHWCEEQLRWKGFIK